MNDKLSETQTGGGPSRLRQQYWQEWGRPSEGPGPHEDRGGPAYIPWLEQRVEDAEDVEHELRQIIRLMSEAAGVADIRVKKLEALAEEGA